MDTSSLRGRVEYLLNQAPDLDAKELSLLAGLAASHVGQIRRGDVVSLQGETAEKLSRVTGARRAWLAFGEGDAPTKEAVEAAVALARAQRDATSDPRPSHPPTPSTEAA